VGSPDFWKVADLKENKRVLLVLRQLRVDVTLEAQSHFGVIINDIGMQPEVNNLLGYVFGRIIL